MQKTTVIKVLVAVFNEAEGNLSNNEIITNVS